MLRDLKSSGEKENDLKILDQKHWAKALFSLFKCYFIPLTTL